MATYLRNAIRRQELAKVTRRDNDAKGEKISSADKGKKTTSTSTKRDRETKKKFANFANGSHPGSAGSGCRKKLGAE